MSDFGLLCLVQGFYYLLSGLWPVVSMSSFLKVTGPKADLWLVKTVAVLVSVIGGVLLLAAARQQNAPEILLLAVASALGLAAIDVIYVSKKVIGPIYLADAAVELALVVFWGLVMA